MREAGREIAPDPEFERMFTELKYLEKSVGRTGMLAIRPAPLADSPGFVEDTPPWRGAALKDKRCHRKDMGAPRPMYHYPTGDPQT